MEKARHADQANRPTVSFVMATHDRCEVLAGTLERLSHCGIDRHEYEIIVVDNASSDRTPEVALPLCDHLIRLGHNAGSCAKTDAVARARGRYIVFLDDDSCPQPGSVRRMVGRFESSPSLGAAGFQIHLPSGSKEGSALPDVFVGCGVGFRADALRAVGGLDRSFFMQAEEYDLAFRLVNAGWGVKVFGDLHVDHAKTAQTRKSERTTYYDIRNNLRIAARYLPDRFHKVYRDDWTQRYAWLAQRDGHLSSFARGLWTGRWRGMLERRTHRRHRLLESTFEQFFQVEFMRRKFADLAKSGVYRVVLADLGKNVFAFYRAAQETGVEVLAIGDDRFAELDRRYRGIPVLPLDEALNLVSDAVVVANSAPVHGTDTYNRLTQRGVERIYHWFEPNEQPISSKSIRSAGAGSEGGAMISKEVAAEC